MKLKSFKHIPAKEAKELHRNASETVFKVTTIKRVHSTEAKESTRKQCYDRVHHKVYVTTLPELIKWIRETEKAAEEIIDIEALF